MKAAGKAVPRTPIEDGRSAKGQVRIKKVGVQRNSMENRTGVVLSYRVERGGACFSCPGDRKCLLPVAS